MKLPMTIGVEKTSGGGVRWLQQGLDGVPVPGLIQQTPSQILATGLKLLEQRSGRRKTEHGLIGSDEQQYKDDSPQ